MKLKKIASLMLAGVMAVSMLAGCSGNGSNNNNNNDDPVVVPGVNVANVISQLDSDTTDKVTFSAGNDIQDALNDGVQDFGILSLRFNENQIITYVGALANVEITSNNDFRTGGDYADDEQTVMRAGVVDTNGMNDTYTLRVLADDIDASVASVTTMVENSLGANTHVQDGDTYYTYEYTGELAIAKVESVSGQSSYIYVYTIDRTPTEVEVNL